MLNMTYYIMMLVPAAFCVLPLAALLYLAAARWMKNKREQPPIWRSLAEYLLIVWLILFLYVTQLLPFGRSEAANWRPLYFFDLAIRFRLFNTEMILQFLLNALMFVPLGMLLPLAFPGRMGKWWRVLYLAAGLSAGTELLQNFSMRGCDIDDLIANVFGALYGYMVYAVIRQIADPEKWERNQKRDRHG